MMLPMYGLILALLVVGGLATIVAVGDPNHVRLAPYLGFICLFAGLGALVFSFIFTIVGDIALHSEALTAAFFFAGYAGGAAIGGLFGYWMAARRTRL
jgi:hypothetical protein